METIYTTGTHGAPYYTTGTTRQERAARRTTRQGAERAQQRSRLQAAEAEAYKRRDEADPDLAGEDLPAHHAHLK